MELIKFVSCHGFSLASSRPSPSLSASGDKTVSFRSAALISVVLCLAIFILWKYPHWDVIPEQDSVSKDLHKDTKGPRNISALLRKPALSTFFFHGRFLTNVFLLPKECLKAYRRDNTGAHETPEPNSNSLAPYNRIDFLIRSHVRDLLGGSGLKPFSQRFYKNVSKRLGNMQSGTEWVSWPDLTKIIQKEITGSAIDALCGPWLLENHPSFLDDFWVFDNNIYSLLLRLPRFLTPRVHEARANLLAAVEAWHQWADAHFDPALISSQDGYDSPWAHPFWRKRREMLLQVDDFSQKGVVSQDLGLLWGSNSNSVLAAFWATFEVFRDLSLLEIVRQEAQDCLIRRDGVELEFDVEQLVRQPVVQAIYAETLRLRVNGILMRKTPMNGLIVNEDFVPGEKLILTASTAAHMDPRVWGVGIGQNRSPYEFWPGRFLKHVRGVNRGVDFSMTGTAGSWMPFGGGTHMCPGRFFAKREVILSMAQMVTLYDCDILSDKGAQKMDGRTFGLGTLGPAGKVPVRLRRRDAFLPPH
ncbi:MAG: hypothetical protein Q9157_006060 [Trypethelium eluteriae]